MTIEGNKQAGQVGVSLLEYIPDEVMLNIFRYIPKLELIPLSITSKRFYRLISGPDLYRGELAAASLVYTVLTGKELVESKETSLQSLATTLKEIERELGSYSFQEISKLNVTEIMVKMRATLCSSLWERTLYKMCCRRILASHRVCPSYTIKSDHTDEHFALIMKSLANTKIKTVNIPSPLPAEQLQVMKQLLSQNKLFIENLSIDGFNHLHSQELISIFEALQSNQTIKRISNTNCIIGQNELEILQKSLQSNNTLESLCFSGFVIDQTGVETLAEICHNDSIRELVFQQYIEVEMRCICEQFDNVSLEKLSFRRGYISKQNAEVLVDMLKKNPNIKTLDLMFNQISQAAQNTLKNANRNQEISTKIKFLSKLR